jgi:hypothetical protein
MKDIMPEECKLLKDQEWLCDLAFFSGHLTLFEYSEHKVAR